MEYFMTKNLKVEKARLTPLRNRSRLRLVLQDIAGALHPGVLPKVILSLALHWMFNWV